MVVELLIYQPNVFPYGFKIVGFQCMRIKKCVEHSLSDCFGR